jgi:hypothetical protein
MTRPGAQTAYPVNCHAPTRRAGAAGGALAALAAVTAAAGLLALASAAPGHRPAAAAEAQPVRGRRRR